MHKRHNFKSETRHISEKVIMNQHSVIVQIANQTKQMNQNFKEVWQSQPLSLKVSMSSGQTTIAWYLVRCHKHSREDWGLRAQGILHLNLGNNALDWDFGTKQHTILLGQPQSSAQQMGGMWEHHWSKHSRKLLRAPSLSPLPYLSLLEIKQDPKEHFPRGTDFDPLDPAPMGSLFILMAFA